MLQRITEFAFSNHTLTASYFRCPAAGEVNMRAAKLLKLEIRTVGTAITKVHLKCIMHLAIHSQHAPIRDMTKSVYLPGNLRIRVRFHSFVETFFNIDRTTNPCVITPGWQLMRARYRTCFDSLYDENLQ